MKSKITSNQLLTNYAKFQNNPTVPFTNNRLLSSNSMFINNQSSVAQNANKLKQENAIKKIQQQNETKQSKDQTLLLNSIIQPSKLDKQNEDKIYGDLKSKYDQRTQLWSNEAQDWRSHRTNEPYKNIIVDNQIKIKDKVVNVKKGKDVRENHVEDLIVYKVTAEDKKTSKQEVEKDFDDDDKKRKAYDEENKIIYSSSKENEHKKEFEYKHKYMYRIKEKAEQHDDLQKEHLDYFKNMQVKMEKDKKRYDDILTAVLDPEDINEEEGGLETESPTVRELSVTIVLVFCN